MLKNWILTAAHCATAVGDNTPVDVFLGATNLGVKEIHIAELIVHEGNDPDTLDNDLALLRLESDSSKPTIDIIEPEDPQGLASPGTMTTVIGWRTTSEAGTPSQDLLEVEVPIVSEETASTAHQPLGSKITENMIAAGLPEGSKDTCQDDSGGPFPVMSPEKSFILAGATSWGIGCARPGLPGIYTRLSRYSDWLSEHLV